MPWSMSIMHFWATSGDVFAPMGSLLQAQFPCSVEITQISWLLGDSTKQWNIMERSIFVKQVCFPHLSMMSCIFGGGCGFLTINAFNFLKSDGHRTRPSFFGAMKLGNPHLDVPMLLKTLSSITLLSSLLNCSCFWKGRISAILGLYLKGPRAEAGRGGLHPLLLHAPLALHVVAEHSKRVGPIRRAVGRSDPVICTAKKPPLGRSLQSKKASLGIGSASLWILLPAVS